MLCVESFHAGARALRLELKNNKDKLNFFSICLVAVICLSCCFSFLGTERSAASAPSKHFQANIRCVPSGLAAMRGVFVGLSFCCVLKTFALRRYPSAALLSKRFKVLCCYEIQADFIFVGLSFCCVLKTFALRCYPSAALLSKRFKVLCCYEIQADYMTIHCVVC